MSDKEIPFNNDFLNELRANAKPLAEMIGPQKKIIKVRLGDSVPVSARLIKVEREMVRDCTSTAGEYPVEFCYFEVFL